MGAPLCISLWERCKSSVPVYYFPRGQKGKGVPRFGPPAVGRTTSSHQIESSDPICFKQPCFLVNSASHKTNRFSDLVSDFVGVRSNSLTPFILMENEGAEGMKTLAAEAR